MLPTRQGSIRLFRFGGIDVFLHWTWFVVAAYQITSRGKIYSSANWIALEYLALFLIVLLHEFGHALACRQVGGQANQIVLWPLGGVAYVAPPPRPGATLWSIAAGPLVNVALAPVLVGLWVWARRSNWAEAMPNAYLFVEAISAINITLLIFNLLPIYPLDGGQILRALLWFGIGHARSLMAATVVGLAGVMILIAAILVWFRSVWLGILAAFIGLSCWRGFQQARALLRLERAPRHDGFACPVCQAAPPRSAFWSCGQCGRPFDTFATQAVCPHCGTEFDTTRCLECGGLSPMSQWKVPPPLPPALPQDS